MRLAIRACFLIAAACGAQSFESATIRPAARGSASSRGPEINAANFTCRNCTMSMALADAFDVTSFQIFGPHWIETERYDLGAKIAPGTTEDQVRAMEQNFLTARFQMKFHRMSREMPVYRLVVAAGAKFKTSSTEAAAVSDESPRGVDKDGYPLLPSGSASRVLMSDGKFAMRGARITMTEFAALLTRRVSRPVLDATGLTGTYDLQMKWTAENLSSALKDQLGLKLEQAQAAVDVVVIDLLEKAPTGN